MDESLISSPGFTQGEDYVLVFRNPSYLIAQRGAFSHKSYSITKAQKRLSDIFHVTRSNESQAHQKILESFNDCIGPVSYETFCAKAIYSVFIILQQHLNIEISLFKSLDESKFFVILKIPEETCKNLATEMKHKLNFNEDAVKNDIEETVKMYTEVEVETRAKSPAVKKQMKKAVIAKVGGAIVDEEAKQNLKDEIKNVVKNQIKEAVGNRIKQKVETEFKELGLSPPYAPYKNDGKKKLDTLFKRYDKNEKENPDGPTMFRHKDRILMINNTLHNQIRIHTLKYHEILLDEFPISDKSKLAVLKKEWARFKNLFRSQPIELIKEYFGEELAFYFSWLEFYIKWLTIPTFFGTIVAILYYISSVTSDKSLISDVSLIIFSLMISSVTSFMDKMWVRIEKKLALKWGVYDYERVERQRSKFKGVYITDPSSGKYKRLYIPEGLEKYAKIFGYFVFILFTSIVIVLVPAVFSLQNSLKSKSAINLVGVLSAIQIKILSTAFSRTARKLTDWENPETDRLYYNSLAQKLFWFEFFNSYASLFFIAFIKSSTVEGCTNGNCMEELQSQITSMFLTNIFMNLAELAIPYAYNLYFLRKIREISKKRKIRRKKAVTKVGFDIKEAEKHVFDHTMDEIMKVGHRDGETFDEDEADKYIFDEKIDEYIKIVTGYGYMVMFGLAFPFTPFFLMFFAILEVRNDAFKLCYLVRRPFPSQDNSIRIWNQIISKVSYIGGAVNLAVLIFTANAFRFENQRDMWICFAVLENSFIFIKFVVIEGIKDTPVNVKNGTTWLKRIIREKTRRND